MNKILYFSTALTLLSPAVQALPLQIDNYNSITENNCTYYETGSSSDVALLNKGYFIIKRGKSDKLFFTRYGRFVTTSNNRLVTPDGYFVQGINSDHQMLQSIKIPMNMPPAPTHKAHIVANFDSSAEINDKKFIGFTMYDSIGNLHSARATMKKIAPDTWQAAIKIDKQFVHTGQISFNSSGRLNSPSKIELQWNSPQGLQNLSIDFKNSTQYKSRFSISLMHFDGNPLGSLVNIQINNDGELIYRYTSGEIKSKLNIAVAKFKYPEKLENVVDNIFVSSQHSGYPYIYSDNGYGAFLSYYLQKDFCIPNDYL